MIVNNCSLFSFLEFPNKCNEISISIELYHLEEPHTSPIIYSKGYLEKYNFVIASKTIRSYTLRQNGFLKSISGQNAF